MLSRHTGGLVGVLTPKKPQAPRRLYRAGAISYQVYPRFMLLSALNI